MEFIGRLHENEPNIIKKGFEKKQIELEKSVVNSIVKNFLNKKVNSMIELQGVKMKELRSLFRLYYEVDEQLLGADYVNLLIRISKVPTDKLILKLQNLKNIASDNFRFLKERDKKNVVRGIIVYSNELGRREDFNEIFLEEISEEGKNKLIDLNEITGRASLKKKIAAVVFINLLFGVGVTTLLAIIGKIISSTKK